MLRTATPPAPRRRRLAAAAAVAALGALLATSAPRAALAQGDGSDDGLRQPVRYTSGVADQFLGELGPDDRTLYFVSNRNTTDEVYAQDVETGALRLLFDEDAEVTWPRISPDGKHLLYVSYRDRAAGQLCIRDLPRGDRRRCLADPADAIQAEWIGADRFLLVARKTLQGDLSVLTVHLGSDFETAPLLSRNLTAPTVSPDGRWLVYVPLERYVPGIGPSFAARAATRLEAVRIDSPSPPVPLAIDLPGLTGQPAFAKDGRSLYVVQFFSDTNHDSVIDANDHGVLFRVPFRADDGAPPAVGIAEQLTDTSWNCQYPAPARERLIATCSKDKTLDVYGWPLTGAVPDTWTSARLRLEVELASKRSQKQLLYSRWLARETDPAKERRLMIRLVALHLDLDEVRAAEFYAQRLARIHDVVTAGASRSLLALVEHRGALRDRERGRSVGDFPGQARARMERLAPRPTDPPAAAALRHVVRSEIADTLGDKGVARAELEAVDPSQPGIPHSILELFYERADALYRELDDRDALTRMSARLSASPEFDGHDQLRFARAAVRSMIRGLPVDEAKAVLARERQTAPPGSELAFAIDLAGQVLVIHDAHPPHAARDDLFALYAAQTRPDRRHAVVLDAMQRAATFDADSVVEGLAQRYIDDVPHGTDEWRRAQSLYRHAILGRAYRRLAAGRLPLARADFDALVDKTGSFEGLLGSLNMRLKAGEAPQGILADYEKKAHAYPTALLRFTKAYLLAAELPKLEGQAHIARVAQIEATLRSSWAELRANSAARALYGAVLHEEYMRTGRLDAAERAGSHYLVALEGSANNPRYKAAILGSLSILHTQVGNYRIALTYMKSRDALPYADNSEGVSVRLSEARALLHVGREDDAATAADQALAMVERAPALAPYRLLALDRAALANLAAHRFARAAALYDQEVPLVDAAPGNGQVRNALVTRLARAASNLGAGQPGRTLVDEAEVERRLAAKGAGEALVWPHATPAQVLETYERIAVGLRAGAHRDLGQLDLAAKDLEQRRALSNDAVARAGKGDPDRALAFFDAELADNASHRHDAAAEAAWMGDALARTDAIYAKSKTIDPGQLDVLWLGAELRALTGAASPADAPERLRKAYDAMQMQHDRALAPYERWFEIYMALLAAPSEAPSDGSVAAPSAAPAAPDQSPASQGSSSGEVHLSSDKSQ